MALAREDTYTRREAAGILGLHYNSIRKMEANGRIETTRVKRGNVEQVRIPKREVERLLQESPARRSDASEVKRLTAENVELRMRLETVDAERRDLLKRLLDVLSSRE